MFVRSCVMVIATLAVAGCASGGYGGAYESYPGTVYYEDAYDDYYYEGYPPYYGAPGYHSYFYDYDDDFRDFDRDRRFHDFDDDDDDDNHDARDAKRFLKKHERPRKIEPRESDRRPDLEDDDAERTSPLFRNRPKRSSDDQPFAMLPRHAQRQQDDGDDQPRWRSQRGGSSCPPKGCPD